ncbi:MAG: hypothetical protein JKY62_11960 [Desulfocapsa sp.]|nr:hypothetical protein [Desulfocapsa sp.]MBL4903348.1 hypothetical protein [Desulfocapsa sp.]
MNRLVVRKNLCHGLLLTVFISFFAMSSFGAVLNPFPKQDRALAPQYQQLSPKYRQVQPSRELEQFRQDIAIFQCPELQALQVRLMSKHQSARTGADKEYYRGFLNELSRAKVKKECN